MTTTGCGRSKAPMICGPGFNVLLPSLLRHNCVSPRLVYFADSFFSIEGLPPLC